MLGTPAFKGRLVFSLLLTWAGVAYAQPGDLGLVDLRLITPLTSYSSPPGTAVRAVVIAPYPGSGPQIMPSGTIVYGTVAKATRVGVGLVHERASLEIDFREYELADGRRFPLRARLYCIDNARESVTSKGRIKGVLAANNPQTLLGGMWRRPSLTLFQRSLIGLTGVSGRIWAVSSWGPIGAASLFLVRCSIFGLPESEIQIPANAELKIALTSLPDDAPSVVAALPADLPGDLAASLRDQPFGVSKLDGQAAADIINVAFAGSREDLQEAFRAAGWQQADVRNARTMRRTYSAYSMQAGYAAAPASKMVYEGAVPEFVFQKSFNTISKRHHVRIWRTELAGREVWFGAATHDIGLAFDSNTMRFTHRIHDRIDLERSKVVNDLAFAGCSETAGSVERPAAARTGVADRGVVTDGRLAVVVLRPCTAVAGSNELDFPKLRRPLLVKLARRMILEGRQYVVRENAYYWTYRGLTWKRADLRNNGASVQE